MRTRRCKARSVNTSEKRETLRTTTIISGETCGAASRFGWGAFFASVLAVVIGFCSLPTTARAQPNVPGAPKLLSYQGVLVEQDGVAVPDSTYTVTLRIYEDEVGGIAVWEETQDVTTLDGVFDAILGLNEPLDDIMFDQPYWLAVELEDESEMTPRMRMISAPYALYTNRAAIADSLAGGVVRSLNTLQGHLTLKGGSGTSITEVGDTIIISSTGAGTQSLSEGSLWYGNPNDDPIELPIGRPNQVLTVNAPGNAPEWSSDITVNSVETDSLKVNGYTEIQGPATFDRLPDFPLKEGSLLAGDTNGRVSELPTTNAPGAVLQQDADGNPTWQTLAPNNLGLLGDKVPTVGKLEQTVNQPGIQAGSKIIVSYQDPAGGANIPVKVVTQTAGSGFTVQFTALPPNDTYIVYVILP